MKIKKTVISTERENHGKYFLPPQIFRILEKISPDGRGEIQLTKGLRELKKNVPIFGYELLGDRYDAGDKSGYLQANISLGLRHQVRGLRRILDDMV